MTKTNELWDHQRRAIDEANAMSSRGTLLDMKMGTGKTRTVIEIANRMNAALKTYVVVCPKAVIPTWSAQLERFGTRPALIVDLGAQPERARLDPGSPLRRTALARGRRGPATLTVAKRALAVGDHAIIARAEQRDLWIVTNYDAARLTDLRAALAKLSIDVLVIDEAHKAKDPKGVTLRSLLTLARRSKRVLALTGTPMPHSPLDIWAQGALCKPDAFGNSFWMFRTRYAVLGGYKGKNVVAFRDLGKMREIMDTFTVHVGADVLKLSAPSDVDIPVRLEPAAREVYSKLDDDMAAAVRNGTVTAANALVKILRLAQVTGGSVMLDGDPLADVAGRLERIGTEKQDALATILDGLDANEPFVVFCRFRSDINAAHAAAESVGRKSLELSGQRHELERWQRGEGTVLVVQIQAGGAGVDLTRACYCAYYSLGFSLGDYLQSRARVHRPGQTRHVTYFHLVAEDTVDQRIYRALSRREDIVRSVLGEYLEAARCPV